MIKEEVQPTESEQAAAVEVERILSNDEPPPEYKSGGQGIDCEDS